MDPEELPHGQPVEGAEDGGDEEQDDGDVHAGGMMNDE
jgi:hypothetical protein